MKTFSIYANSSLGMSHSGPCEAGSVGTVTLDEDQIEELVNLIRAHDGETDPYWLDLENELPDVYELLDEAYREAAWTAEYNSLVMDGYRSHYYEEPADLIQTCIDNYGFDSAPNKDDYMDGDEFDDISYNSDLREAFDSWLTSYIKSLDEAKAVNFIAGVLCCEPDMTCMNLNYTVKIPKEIVEMAEK